MMRIKSIVVVAVMMAFAMGCGGSSGTNPATSSDSSSTPEGSGPTVTAADVTVKLIRLDGSKMELSDRPIPRRVSVEVTFSRAMTDTAAVEAGASLVDDAGKSVAGTLVWNADKTVMTWTPSTNLRYRTTYHAQITEAALLKTFEKAAPVEASFTTMTEGDVNGDGKSDIVSSGENYFKGTIWNMGMAAVFSGATLAANTPITDALVEFFGAQDDYLGRTVAFAGDVNADGYEDVLISAPEHTSGVDGKVGEVFLFSGKELSAATTLADAASTIIGIVGDASFGKTLAGIGDVNNDGYSDFAAQADVPGMSWYHDVFIFSGKDLAKTQRADQALVSIRGGASEQFGDSIAAAGDIDADGYDDVLVGAPAIDDGATTDVGALYLFSGKSMTAGTTVADAAAKILGNTANGMFGNVCAGVGDINGDGTPDVAANAPQIDNAKGAVYFFDGKTVASVTSVTQAFATVAGETNSDQLGRSVAGIGDVDGDGKDDVALGDNMAGSGFKGRFHVFSGKDISGNMDIGDAFVTVAGKNNSDGLGLTMGGAGDVDGDGRADIVVGARGYPAGAAEGAVYLLSGASLTSTTTVDNAKYLMAGHTGINSEFGMSVGTVRR